MQHSNKKSEEILKATASVIKHLRQEKGLSLNIFAYENDLQKSLVSRLENGKNEPAFLSIWKIAQALGIKPSEFVKKIEEKLPKNWSILDE